MKRFTLRSWLMGGLLLASVLGGCSPDFAPFNRLTSLRVLAIQSEPAAPTLGETATISALVFTPTPDDLSLTYAWSWCPFPGQGEAGYPCLITEEQVAMFGQVPPFDLGAAPTAMLTNSVDPAALAALCAGVPGAPAAPDCANGFPIQIKLTVTTDTDEVVAVATARWRFDPARGPNANPTITGLSAMVGGGSQPIDEQLSVTLPRAVTTPIMAAAPPEASETYEGLDDDGNPATLGERLFITWFVETGDTDDQRTSFLRNRTDFEAMLKNSWKPAGEKENYQKEDARMFAVIHDNRGGVGWRAGIVRLGPTP